MAASKTLSFAHARVIEEERALLAELHRAAVGGSSERRGDRGPVLT